MTVMFETAAELVQKLGNIPLERICFNPPPGTATERDLRAAMRRTTHQLSGDLLRVIISRWSKP